VCTLEIAGEPARQGGDNVGCGDAYLALLVHGALAGWDLEDAGRAASRWAAEVASQRGATPTFGEDLVASLLGCDD
jgi:sugar/nucleoside kinase (ribokinase family)